MRYDLRRPVLVVGATTGVEAVREVELQGQRPCKTIVADVVFLDGVLLG